MYYYYYYYYSFLLLLLFLLSYYNNFTFSTELFFSEINSRPVLSFGVIIHFRSVATFVFTVSFYCFRAVPYSVPDCSFNIPGENNGDKKNYNKKRKREREGSGEILSDQDVLHLKLPFSMQFFL